MTKKTWSHGWISVEHTNTEAWSLQGNKLTGRISELIGLMQALAVLNVHGNRLNGTIPLEFRKIDNLTYFDLSKSDIVGPIPGSVGDLEHLLKLELEWK